MKVSQRFGVHLFGSEDHGRTWKTIGMPTPSRALGSVKAERLTPYGKVASSWRYEGDKWIWEFTVPHNATAAVTVPGEEFSRLYDEGTHRIERKVKAPERRR